MNINYIIDPEIIPIKHEYDAKIKTETYEYTLSFKTIYFEYNFRYTIKKRYSEWLKLYNYLYTNYGKIIDTMYNKFPPKVYFNTSNSLVQERFEKICHFLNEIIQYVDIIHDKKFILFFGGNYDEITTKNNKSDFDINKYCIEWVGENEGHVDFINGFIEVYGDPLGMKGSWEGLVEYRDVEGSRRTRTISDNAQWFEDHSPVDPRFRKPHVKGVTANVICAAMLGGDEYPATAIGINLPNADWIRARYGSKSITISNITAAYNEASRGSGFKEEFVIDRETMELIDKYGGYCDDLHTDLHECLGHGSGRLLDGVDPDSLKAYGSTIEEARADLFALYYMADEKMLELGLLPDKEAYKSQYYTYIMNGMMTQLVRIKPGNKIEEAHMRNRALIARWCYEKGCGEGVVELVSRNDKTFVRINSYEKLRSLFATFLAEIQRIKSEGDYDAARELVEKYAVDIDPVLHDEIIRRYERLNLAPYKGFINPVLKPVLDDNGEITDIDVDYTETYTAQMLRYGREFGL